MGIQVSQTLFVASHLCSRYQALWPVILQARCRLSLQDRAQACTVFGHSAYISYGALPRLVVVLLAQSIQSSLAPVRLAGLPNTVMSTHIYIRRYPAFRATVHSLTFLPHITLRFLYCPALRCNSYLPRRILSLSFVRPPMYLSSQYFLGAPQPLILPPP